MDTIGIGLIGTGGRLRGVLKSVLANDERFRVVSAYDPSADSLAALESMLGYEVPACGHYRDVAQDPAVQYVMIGSWNCFHAEQVIATLEAGKPLFCEKPVATTFADALAMARAQQAAKLPLTIGFTLRYSPFYRALKELLAGGRIGSIVSMEFNETLDFNHGGYIHGDWRRLRANAGTHLLEKCCHDVDLVNWMLESRAARVASFGGTDFFTPENVHHQERIGPNPKTGKPAFQSWPHRDQDPPNPFLADKDIIDNQVAIVQFANGVRTTFHTNCASAIPERRMYICGSEGSIRADVITGKIEIARIGWDQAIETLEPGAKGGHGGGDGILAGEVAASILHGTPPSSTLADGLQSAVTCFGIDQALDEGRVVDMADYWRQLDAATS